MPSTLASKALWRAVVFYLVIKFIDRVTSHYLWQNLDLGIEIPEELQPAPNENVESSNRTFWLKTLPKEMVWLALISPIAYKWQCWLERKFPARRLSGSPISSYQQKQRDDVGDIDSDEDRDEKVMRKLIAQGKVRRAGFSWFNTFVKWILDTVFIDLVWCSLFILYDAAWKLQGISRIQADFRASIIPMYIFSIFSFGTFTCLVALIVVPVQHRLPFAGALMLAWHVFFGAVSLAFVPFFMNLDITQQVIRNTTEAMRQARNATASNSTSSSLPVIGEL